MACIDLSDGKCFQTEYERYFIALKYFACRYIGDEDTVCDLLQDFFVKLWEHGNRFGDESAFKVYLYKSVRNRCLTYLRDCQSREKRLKEYEQEESEESAVHRMIEAEIYALVNEIFTELPPAAREVYARSLDGKSHQEIADELNIAINTIKKHKNNANRYLRARLEKLIAFMLYVG